MRITLHSRKIVVGMTAADSSLNMVGIGDFAEDLPFEFMMNALRLTDGVPAAMLQERTGVPTAKIMAQIETARQKGLLESDPTVFRPTEQGCLFLNDLLQCFL